MKIKLLLTILIATSINCYSQLDVADKSKKPEIKAIPYDGSFMDFSDVMLTTEQKAGVVGEKITLFKVWSIKNEDGTKVSYSDSEKFENKTFEVVDYIYDYKDVLKIRNSDGTYIIELSSIDEYVFNSFIDTIKSKLENKSFIPLKMESEIESLNGDIIKIDGLKEYLISKVTFSKLTLGYGIVVEINEEFEVVYPIGTFDQLTDKGWINLESADVFKSKTTFIEKEAFSNFKESNKLYFNDIRKGNVKIGMNEKQCRYSWGTPTSSMNNIAGYDKVLIYGNVANSQNLYFKKGILSLIK